MTNHTRPATSHALRAGRVLKALSLGALSGGMLTSTIIVVPGLIVSLITPEVDGPGLMPGVLLVLLVAVVAALVFCAGLLMVAAPAWWALHRLGYRGVWHAVIMGASLASAIFFSVATYQHGWGPERSDGGTFSASQGGVPTVVENRLTQQGWINAAELTALIATVAAVTAAIIWAYAYERGPFRHRSRASTAM